MGKYTTAQKLIDDRRQRAKSTQATHEQEIYQKFPQIKQIRNDIISINATLISAVLKREKNVSSLTERIKSQTTTKRLEYVSILIENGYPADYLDIHYSCPLCEDQGFLNGDRCVCLKNLANTVATSEFTDQTPIRASTFDTIDLKYYPTTKIPNREITIRDHMKTVLENCTRYAKNFSLKSDSILMLGGTGLGKTHFSFAIANEVINKNFSVVYVSANDLFRHLNDEYFNRLNDDKYSIATVLASDLLIIDDLGSEFQTALSKSYLYNIVNTRILDNKPTIMSTNLSLSELNKQYEDRIISRLTTLYATALFYGQDVRLLIKKKSNQKKTEN